MPEPAPTRDLRRVVACFAIGVAATALAAAGGIAAALGGWLAQPAFALAVRGWRGTGGAAGEPAGARLKRDLSALGVAWAGVLLLVGVLVAWPLSSLRESGSLGATLALSAVAGLSLIGLWRLWPLWHGIERDGGALARHWQALGERDASTWLGLAAAACLAAVVATVLLLAWPGLLSRETRWLLAGASVVGWPMLHLLLQRLPSATALPLQVVEMTGDPAAVDLAAEDGEDPEVALYAAARRGRVDRALELLEAGASPDALPPADDRDQRALPVLAAVLPDLRLLRALIGRGVDVNAPHAGMTPLIAATRDSWHGRPEAVMTLLANGADPRARDRDGNTPLHHAARSSDPGVAALLRDASAELDTCNDDGVTPLGIACAAGNWRLARFLLERGARAEVPSASPALLSAAGGEDDDAAGVQLLLKHKARVDARDRDQRTALLEAAFAGHAEIAGVLLAAGADVAARDIHGRTPLLEAARGGRLAAFEVLVAAKAAFDVTDGEQRGALLLAARADTASPPLLRRLLELGADVEARDRDGRRALDHAAEAGRWSLVAVLDPAYALPLSVAPDAEDGALADRAPIDLLRDGLREGRAAQLDALAGLLSPAELGALLVDDDGTPPTPVHIEWLMAHGADPDVLRADGDTPVFALLSEGPAALPALQAMLRLGVSPAGAGGLARFLSACASDDVAGRGLEQCALDLMARGADPFAPSPDGEPVPGLAVRLGWPRLLQRLIDTGVGLDARDARGMTALHLAAALGRDAALKTLVAHGASPDVRAADGQTPLGVALSAGRRDLADWLDWRGWPLPGRALRPDDLPAAAVAGDTDALRRLIDLGFDVDATDAQGCTALLRAAGGGHADAVSLLLGRGADVRRAASTGATPLSAAVSMRHAAIVDRLLAAGATLEQRLPGEVTVLMLAAALGLPDLCARLLTAGADIEATDAQGLTPLHCASLFAFTARDRPRLTTLMDTLLLGGADVDAAAAGGVTPLLLLLGARAEPGTACDEDALIGGLEQLLDEGASLDVQDPRGFGPLHLAALHGLLRTTQRLLRAGADPDLRDALNRTPREIAVMRGFVDVAGEFTPLQSGVSMARFLREPR